MSAPIRVETLKDPAHYTSAQVERAKRIAHALARGRLVLCEPPRGR
ncbi:hypothetical protein OM076_20165 [Solirubrobacter ginsenosidimutans]|uniref:Uncharacterized protein n=1 Tax=Solirubrobacter ginsenosidimutans TaxID=490573 RepID=A0A9X3S0X8_9ACTN|nr:hypothetical protein [Solirubrobacter ginsenosidimutans]MDA0162600.1 hypothetical protein [Solirubrobacter ginsenosidimutans]